MPDYSSFCCYIAIVLLKVCLLADADDASPSSSTLIQVSEEKEACLYSHNYIRKLHNTGPLHWDTELANKAKDWALVLSELGRIKHSKTNFQYRENIHHYFQGSEGYTITSALRSWYETIHEYNYNKNQIDKDKPYALMGVIMLWGETTRLGCAISRNRRTGEGFVVVMYGPGVSDHSSANYKINIKRPKGYSDNGYIDSSRITIPSIDELTIPDALVHDYEWKKAKKK